METQIGRQSASFVKLQHSAEKLFFLVLLPYYASNLSLELLGKDSVSAPWVIPAWLVVGVVGAWRIKIALCLRKLVQFIGDSGRRSDDFGPYFVAPL